MQGHLRIMAWHPDGTVQILGTGATAEVPLAVLGETVVFGRFPGGESTIPFFEGPFGHRYPDGELFRIAPGGEPEFLGKTRGFIALLCAGGRATPCLLAEHSGDQVIAVEWDAATGACGRQRARWSMTVYPPASGLALSPDGRTLAQGLKYPLGELSLLDLETGSRRPISMPGAWLHFPHWRPDGTLLAMAASRARCEIVRVGDAGKLEPIARVSEHPLTDGRDFHVTPDGKTAAVLVTRSQDTYWWAPRSPD